jgi:hypothetical protein
MDKEDQVETEDAASGLFYDKIKSFNGNILEWLVTRRTMLLAC